MAGKIPEHFIQEVLARVDLVELIDARVPLKRSGGNFIARCPFHNEKSPSFSVSRDKQFYHCFGCGASGNAIGFLMEYDRLSFREAMETLADTAGLKIPEEPRPGKPDTPRPEPTADLYAVLDWAARCYQTQLKTHPEAARAVEYLKGRGVTGEIAQRYRLGYAPPGYRVLPQDFPLDTLKAAGLVTVKEGGTAYDWFRDRVVFPIRDRRGRVVGFGGRVLGDGVPKYLNSPETATFKKSHEVYGLYELLNAVRKPEFVLVVEGYMDVIALAQFGIPNAVATLGTATSGDHINLLFRYAGELVFCFDGDTAGRNAAWKALEASLPALRDGRQLRFLILPEQHDPDSLVREEGTEAFLARIKNAKPFSHYFFERLTQGLNLTAMAGNTGDQAGLINQAKPLIKQMPSGELREMMQKRLMELAGQTPLESPRNSAKLVGTRRGGGKRGPPSLLRLCLALLLQNPQLAAAIAAPTRQHLIQTGKGGRLAAQILGLLDQHPGLTPGAILEYFRDSQDARTVAALLGFDTQVSPEKIPEVFADTLLKLEKQLKAQRYDELQSKPLTVLSSEEREELLTLLGEIK
ncbi:DNA primase [Methylomagnum ishizawai]|uniref:DNA primase n=1 Tax=Methylomagnum ishizawai TaxID=1760988 RepID=A0A1Y6D1M0_9GAMM|nr:DNA primase [Methylomagnum ishizawai]SMF96839.1 DNA primase [Methylomagnum ishizawai]